MLGISRLAVVMAPLLGPRPTQKDPTLPGQPAINIGPWNIRLATHCLRLARRL